MSEPLERIAAALEGILSKLDHIGGTTTLETVKKPVKKPLPVKKPVKKPLPVKKPVKPMTAVELDSALEKEAARLGGAEKIWQCIQELGAESLKTLDEGHYAKLLEKVRES